MKLGTGRSMLGTTFPQLLALGLVQLALTVFAAHAVDPRTTFPAYLALYFAMGVPWLFATYVAVRRASGAPRVLWLIFGFATLMRACFLLTEPVLSDDIYRYVWDGRVAGAGVNPYHYAPEAPELAHLRDELYPGINNKDIPTIYPPFMQTVFRLVTAIGDSLFAMKAFFTVVDLALLVVLALLLAAKKVAPSRLVVYAWCPLPIVEIAGSGHNDVLGVLCLMAALLALERRRDTLSIAFLTLSGLAKLVGFALVPLFVRFVRPRALAVAPLLALVFVFPYADAGGIAFTGLTQYGLRWRSNDSLFHLLYVVTGSLDVAKLLVASVLVTLALGLAAARIPPLRASYLTLGAILLLMTTVHPWYLLWIAPFLCFYPSAAWLYLMLGVGLSYHAFYLSTPGTAWEEILWIKLLEYVPFFAIALTGWARRLSRRRADASPPLGLDSSMP